MPSARSVRVRPVLPAEWTAAHRNLVATFGGDAPVEPLLAALLHMPELVEATLPMTRYVTERSTLSASHRLLLALRTASLDGSDVVWEMLTTRGADRRTRDAALAITDDDSDDLDRVSRWLLRLADELVLTTSVHGSTWAALADDHEVTWMMDAVETVAHVSFLSCLARTFGVSPDNHSIGDEIAGQPHGWPGLSGVPDREPPPTSARIQPIDGDAIAVVRTFARHPVMAAARRPRADFVNHVSPLTPHDRETLILRIGWDCRSEYEWAKHVGSVGQARQHGVDPDRVAAGPAATGVSDHDAVLMRVADDLHRNSTVSDDTWSSLHDNWGLQGAMSAVATAASYRATCMSLNAYAVQLEPGDEGFPPADR